MRGLRSTLVLFVVAVGLGAYIYFVEMKKPAPGGEPPRDKMFAVEAGDITALTVTAGTGEESVLEKSDVGWKLVQPVAARADEAEVSSLTSGLANLEIQRVVDEDPQDLAQYGLAEPRIDVSFKSAAQATATHLHFGNKTPTGGDMYARVADQKRVFLVSAYLDSTFDKKPFDLRDKTILEFDRNKAETVELSRDAASVAMKKSGDQWALLQPVAARADYGSVEGLIGRLQTAQMRSIVAEEAADLKPYGLDKPEVRATVGLGSARATLELGAKTDDGSFYARDTSKPMVFTVESSFADELRKPADDFRRKDVFEFRTFTATAVEITRGTDTRTYEKSKGPETDALEQWRQAKPAAANIDQAALESFLSTLSNLRAQSFVAPGTKVGIESPEATFVVRFDDGKKEERVVFSRLGGEVYASRPDEPGAAKIDTTEFDGALQALDEVKEVKEEKQDEKKEDVK